MNAAGITGRPNIDWCEDNKPATMRTNVIGTLNLADLCDERGIHCTVYATGCIFVYDEAHPEGSGIGFTEEDIPNFDGSFYSQTKGYMEPMLKEYPSCLILRVRMPVSDDLFHRNFVTKIVKYEKVVNIPNSMTILTEMLPASLAMAKKGLTGVYNFTNPGVISHNQVLDLYTKYIDPSYTIRGLPANSMDSGYCLVLGQHAVHAGMAGRTNMMVGFWNHAFTHVPLPLVAQGRKHLEPGEEVWQRVLDATGQPWQMVGT